MVALPAPINDERYVCEFQPISSSSWSSMATYNADRLVCTASLPDNARTAGQGTSQPINRSINQSINQSVYSSAFNGINDSARLLWCWLDIEESVYTFRRPTCCGKIFVARSLRQSSRERCTHFTGIQISHTTLCRMARRSSPAKSSSICLSVSIAHRLVTDRQTDRQTDRHRAIASTRGSITSPGYRAKRRMTTNGFIPISRLSRQYHFHVSLVSWLQLN